MLLVGEYHSYGHKHLHLRTARPIIHSTVLEIDGTFCQSDSMEKDTSHCPPYNRRVSLELVAVERTKFKRSTTLSAQRGQTRPPDPVYVSHGILHLLLHQPGCVFTYTTQAQVSNEDREKLCPFLRPHLIKTATVP